MQKLIDILPDELKDGLTPAEETLLTKAHIGEPAVFLSEKDDENDLEKAESWGPERTIRPKLLYWLCTHEDAAKSVHARGIQVGGAKVAGDLDFDSATIHRPLKIIKCTIGIINLRDAEARFLGLGECKISALIASRLTCRGSFHLRATKISGGVELIGANIVGDLDCTDAELKNPDGYVFNADRIYVKGNVYLNVKKATGEVRLLGADIGGDLSCTGAELQNPKGYAFNADGVKVKGNVYLNVKKATGEVRLLGADIGGDLSCTGAEFENKKSDALNLQGAVIKGALLLNDAKIDGDLDLSSASAGPFLDDEKSWPAPGMVFIDGFEYKTLAGPSTPKTAKERKKWLRLQPKVDNRGNKLFLPQPYEQLAKVFRQMGHEADAREVLIAKHEDLRKSGLLNRRASFRNWLAGVTLRHGYSPWRVAAFMLLMLIVGTVIFEIAFCNQVMQPSKERVYMDPGYRGLADLKPQYPDFNSFVYSIDAFVPVLSLHQEEYWLPQAEPSGAFFRFWLWFHIISGWVSTSLIIVYFTGLVRKE